MIIGVVRYDIALLGHTQRYLPAVLLYLGLLAMLLRDTQAPPMPEFAITAGALAMVACWLTIALVDAEHEVQRLVTISHARRVSTVVGAIATTVLSICVVLIVLCGAWSLIMHGAAVAATLGYAAAAHLACACVGVAVGLPCSRLLIARIGYSVVTAVLGLALFLLVRWVPVVNPMLRAMGTDGASVALPVLLGTVASVLALLVSVRVVAVVVRKRS